MQHSWSCWVKFNAGAQGELSPRLQSGYGPAVPAPWLLYRLQAGKPMEWFLQKVLVWECNTPGGKCGDPPDIREVLQKSPLVWESRKAARNGVHKRELGVSLLILSVDLVLLSSHVCMIISQYLQLNIEEEALTVK